MFHVLRLTALVFKTPEKGQPYMSCSATIDLRQKRILLDFENESRVDLYFLHNPQLQYVSSNVLLGTKMRIIVL